MLTIDSGKMKTLKNIPKISGDDINAKLGIRYILNEHFQRLTSHQIDSWILPHKLGARQLNNNLKHSI